MLAYYFFFLFYGLGSSLHYVKNNCNIRLFLRFGGILMVLFVGLRYKIASDWMSYMRFYEKIGDISGLLSKEFVLIEPGFKLLMSVFQTAGFSFEMFVFAISLFNVYSLFSFIRRIQISYPLTFLSIFLILYVFRDFDILRQSIAFYLMLFAFDKHGIRSLRFFILCPLALMFHYTAIIFIPFFFFQKIKITKYTLWLITILYVVSLFYIIPVIAVFINFLLLFVPEPLQIFLYKAQNLTDTFGFARNISFSTVLNIVFLLLPALNFKRIKLFKPSELTLLKIFLFYIVIHILCREIQEVADRLSYYFALGIAFMFVALNRLVLLKEMKHFMLVVPCLFICLKLYLHFNDPAVRYGQTPYRNYIFKSMYNENEIYSRYDMMQKLGNESNEGKKK